MANTASTIQYPRRDPAQQRKPETTSRNSINDTAAVLFITHRRNVKGSGGITNGSFRGRRDALTDFILERNRRGHHPLKFHLPVLS